MRPRSRPVPGHHTAAVLRGVREIVLEDRPTPQPGPAEVLVAVSAVGICASDVNYYRRFRSRVRTGDPETPLVLGHEVAGVVVDRGPDARRAEVGDRVALEPGIPCRRCRECVSGAYNLCRSLSFYGSRPTDGALCGYVVLPDELVHRVSANVDDDAAALAEPLAVAVRAVRRADVSAGSRVLVTGVGTIGLLTVQVARALGATEVVVSDVIDDRLRLARAMGATSTLEGLLTDLPAEDEFDALIECSGVADVAAWGTGAVRPGGHVVLVGIGKERSIPLPVATIQARELWVTGSYRYADDFRRAIALLEAGAVDPRGVITHRHPLSETSAALQTASDDPSCVKAMVYPGDEVAHSGDFAVVRCDPVDVERVPGHDVLGGSDGTAGVHRNPSPS